MSAGNLWHGIPAEELPQELFTTLHQACGIRIERIVSHGHSSSPGFWYDQAEHEWIVVLQGNAELQFEGEPQPRTLSRGSYLNIPAHLRHRVIWTDPAEKTIWLAIYYGDAAGDPSAARR